MNCYIISLGCAKNLVDSEHICGLLKSGGVTFVNRPSSADFIVINTCGFIESAKKEAIDTIFEMLEYKHSKGCKVFVCGCLAQRYLEALKQEIPEVDCYIPIDDYGQMAKIFNEQLGLNITKQYGKNTRIISNNPWMAYLKIGDGCDNRCAYCAIPLIRGKFRSFPVDDLVSQAKQLASQGVKELVLIAQDTTCYGRDFEGHKMLLAPLLSQLNAIEQLHWIRVLYLYPDEIELDLLDEMTKLDKVIPYFDIPLQHANNRLLKKMNRRGTKQDYYQLIKEIRNRFPNAILRTTMIVGFPSESDDEFNEMLDFIKDIQWDHLGAFTYSDEEDTAAYDMDDKIEQEVMDQRYHLLMALQYELFVQKYSQLIGQEIEVLVEKKDAITQLYYGRSIYNAPDGVDGEVIFKSDKDIAFGQFVQVKIKRLKGYDLIGEYVG